MSDQDNVGRARGYGQRGERLPADMRGDPAYEAAHQEGRTARMLARRGDSAHTSERDHPLIPRRPATRPAEGAPPPGRPPARPAATRHASTRNASRPARARRPGYWSRAFSPSAAAKRAGFGEVASAGDAGGLLLALVLYPLFLSVIKYGPAGPGMWFHAKWLNQTSDTSPGKIQGPIVGKGTGPRQRGGGGGGVHIGLPQ